MSRQSNNFVGIAGSGFASNTAYSIVVGIGNATGPGAHNLNVFAGGDGSSVIVGSTTTGYATALRAAAGL